MGVTIEQGAEDPRVREKFLQAIESGDYQSLPGTVYTKGFLRNYAGYLSLDAEEMLALYTGERGGSEPARSFAPMRPLVKRSFIFTPTVLVPVLVLRGVHGEGQDESRRPDHRSGLAGARHVQRRAPGARRHVQRHGALEARPQP